SFLPCPKTRGFSWFSPDFSSLIAWPDAPLRYGSGWSGRKYSSARMSVPRLIQRRHQHIKASHNDSGKRVCVPRCFLIVAQLAGVLKRDAAPNVSDLVHPLTPMI